MGECITTARQSVHPSLDAITVRLTVCGVLSCIPPAGFNLLSWLLVRTRWYVSSDLPVSDVLRCQAMGLLALTCRAACRPVPIPTLDEFILLHKALQAAVQAQPEMLGLLQGARRSFGWNVLGDR